MYEGIIYNICRIGIKMLDFGLDELLVRRIIKFALDYQTTFDLVLMWDKVNNLLSYANELRESIVNRKYEDSGYLRERVDNVVKSITSIEHTIIDNIRDQIDRIQEGH